MSTTERRWCTFTCVATAVTLTLASSLAIQLLDDLLVRVSIGAAVTTVLLIFGALLRRRPRFQQCADAIFALGALSVFGWMSAIITSNQAVEDWVTAAPPAAAFLAVNSMKLTSVAVLMIVIVTYGWSPRRLLLVRGRLNAPTGIPHVGWALAAPAVIVVVAVLFLTDPAVLDKATDAGELSRSLLAVLPLLLAGPLVNAVSEELLYRHALIGTMAPVVGARTALMISSTIFGLGHITGSPGGWTGVAYTLVYGLVTGLAMLQTQGAAWNTTMHFFADLAAVTAITIGSSAGTG